MKNNLFDLTGKLLSLQEVQDCLQYEHALALNEYGAESDFVI
jgi:hypothetical protein